MTIMMMMMMIMMMKMIIAVFAFLAITPPKIFGLKTKKRVIFMQKHNFFVKQIFFLHEVEILTFFDGDDDEDEYSYNSVNFQARTSRFCMEVDLDNIGFVPARIFYTGSQIVIWRAW